MTRARDTANLVGSGNFSSTTFTATAGQTAFTISHTQGFVQVFMNGLLLDETVDYASNGTAITLTSGAAVGDEIEVVSYDTFSVGDAQTQAQADARYIQTTGPLAAGAENSFQSRVQTNVADNQNRTLTLSEQKITFGAPDSYGTSYDAFINYGLTSLQFGAGNTEKIRIDADGLKFNGDTAAVNALDDYEEGTFNLTLAGYYGNPSTTQTIAGYYTKVGNVIHIFCRQGAINNTGASGHMWCTGLPFASMTPYTVLSCTMDNMGTYPNSSPMAYCAGSVAYIDKHVDQGTRTAVFHNVTTSGVITITGSYRI